MTSKLKSKLNEMRELLSGTQRPGKFDLPSSGRIAMSQINEELGNSPTARLSLRAAADEFGLPSGRVAMSDFYGLSLYSHELTIGVDGGGFSHGFQSGFGDLQPRTFETTGSAVITVSQFYVTNNSGEDGIVTQTSTTSATIEFSAKGANGEDLGSASVTFFGNSGEFSNQALADYLRANSGPSGSEGRVYLTDLNA